MTMGRHGNLFKFISLWVFMVLALFCVTGQAKKPAKQYQSGQVFQVSTFSALLQGVFDGDYTMQALAQHGNFGLGTFNAVDGELIAVDGEFYRIDANGNVKIALHKQQTPFAQVVDFQPQYHFSLRNVDSYQAFNQQLQEKLANPNIPYAIRVTGDFSQQNLRSLKPQPAPYVTLDEAAKQQSEYVLNDTQGVMVGFWFPAYFQGISVGGFHFHYINEARTRGGHVLDFVLTQAEVAIEPLYTIDLQLPTSKNFAHVELAGDHAARIEQIENASNQAQD